MMKQKAVSTLSVFILVTLVYGFLSVVFDEIYFKVDRGESPAGFAETLLYYILYFLLRLFPFSIFMVIVYNFFHIQLNIDRSRALFALGFGAFFGLLGGLMLGVEGSYYIGYLRHQRNVLLGVSIGLVVEVIRILVYKRK